MKKYFRRVLSSVVAFAMFFMIFSSTAFAAETEKTQAIKVSDNSVTFTNVDKLKLNESVEYQIVDRKGNPATVGIEKIAETKAVTGSLAKAVAANTVKVWYTGVTINAHFYMTVSNNRVTSVYDDWILIIGGTYSNDSLTRTSTYGKLSFTVNAYGGIMAAKCWLKGTVTGSGNNVNATWQM